MSKKIKVGLIRVLTTTDDAILTAHSKLLMSRFPEFDVQTKCIEDQFEGVYDAETEKIAVPKIIEVARDFEKRGFDTVFVSCAADPGVKECKSLLNIPVIGAGSACASVALNLGGTVGILGITEDVPDVMAEILGNRIAFSLKPDHVDTTLDLLNPVRNSSVLEAAKVLKDKGCDTVALACTGMSTIGVAQKISSRLDIRVVDPVLAGGCIMSYLML